MVAEVVALHERLGPKAFRDLIGGGSAAVNEGQEGSSRRRQAGGLQPVMLTETWVDGWAAAMM